MKEGVKEKRERMKLFRSGGNRGDKRYTINSMNMSMVFEMMFKSLYEKVRLEMRLNILEKKYIICILLLIMIMYSIY